MSHENVRSSVGRYAGDLRGELEADPGVAQILAAGARSAGAPGEDDFRPDAYTGEAALAYLQAAHPRFLFIGLGDTDEYGHADDYRAYLDALRRADELIGRVAHFVFQEIALGRRTTLLVTTDHGRAYSFTSHGAESPESSRVWLVAAGSGVAARGLVESGRERHLADIAPTIRALLGLPAVSPSDSGEMLRELLLPQPSTIAARTHSQLALAANGATRSAF
jgi:arylsulfatase A-like enzyme